MVSVTASQQFPLFVLGKFGLRLMPRCRRGVPDVGVRALGQSNDGQVSIGIDGGVALTPASDSAYRIQRAMNTAGYESKATRVPP